MSIHAGVRLTSKDIELIMDCLIHADPDTSDFKVGRTYRGKPTIKTREHLAALYQKVGQAFGEENISLEFEYDR